MLFFHRRLLGFGYQHQFGQVSLFQCDSTEVVKQQAFGNGHQKGPWLARFLQLLTAEQTHERVLTQVFGPLRAGHVAPKPGQQPTAMVAI